MPKILPDSINLEIAMLILRCFLEDYHNEFLDTKKCPIGCHTECDGCPVCTEGLLLAYKTEGKLETIATRHLSALIKAAHKGDPSGVFRVGSKASIEYLIEAFYGDPDYIP